MFVDVGHVTNLVLATHRLWRFEENFSFIANVHRESTVIAASILILPDLLIVEATFCEEFMKEYKLAYDGNAFFTPEGRMTNDLMLRREIYHS